MAKQSINPKLQTLNKKDCVGFLLKFNSLVHIGIYCYLFTEVEVTSIAYLPRPRSGEVNIQY